jgi:DNA-binding NarL/FixJ family response regulator
MRLMRKAIYKCRSVGFKGYITKNCNSWDIITVIEDVLAGKECFPIIQRKDYLI